MAEFAPGVRNAVRALIIRDEAILVQHKVYEDGSERYVLPGGATDSGETLIEGLKRECLEEIGCEVEVDDAIHIADFFKPGKNGSTAKRQQIEFIFRCHVPETYLPKNGNNPDKHQKAVTWLKISQLDSQPFFPVSLIDVISQSNAPKPVYIGLIE